LARWQSGRADHAHVDKNFNEFQDNEWGLFGWFECEDDADAARALLDAAEAWLRERGRDRMVGPMDFTTNDECGLLIEGYEHPPIILCPWHHPYYQRLFEQDLNLQKAMDLYMWSLNVEGREKVHPAIWEVAGKVESEHGIVCRNFRKKDLQAEVDRFVEIYNSAWERNWGFVPLTEQEVRHYAKDLKPILDENWAMVAEHKDTGEVVGAALTLPDYNQVLAKLNGRLLPLGWLTALRERKKIDAVRVIVLGVKSDYRHTGVAARFYQMHFDAAEHTPQKGGEMGWILETNTPMNRAMEGMGGEIKRRYRVYERML
jgi:GNAT superfamily N-acetyltransferase